MQMYSVAVWMVNPKMLTLIICNQTIIYRVILGLLYIIDRHCKHVIRKSYYIIKIYNDTNPRSTSITEGFVMLLQYEYRYRHCLSMITYLIKDKKSIYVLLQLLKLEFC